MIDYPETDHVAFDLENTLSHAPPLPAKTIGPPDLYEIRQVHAYRSRGVPVVLLSPRVDNEARSVRLSSLALSREALRTWEYRIHRDMIARLIIATWCIDNIGYYLPVTNVRHPKMMVIF